MERILIVGGGYAGLYTAWGLEKRLRNGEAEVTLVDPRPYMTYQPFLPEVASGGVEPRHTVVSLRRHLRHTRLVAGSVTSLSHRRRLARVHPLDGDDYDLAYDTVVVTAGAVSRTFAIPGLLDIAIGLKTVEEAAWIRDQLLEAFERASGLPAGPSRARLLTVTVVGGGFSGVELVGELLSLARALVPLYPSLAANEVSFHLVEATDRILPEVTERPGEWVVDRLRSRGAIVHLGVQLMSAEEGQVRLSDGTTYRGNLLVWAAGNAATTVVTGHTDLPIDDRGLVPVAPDLRVLGAEGIVPGAWAAGDNAAVPDLASTRDGARAVPNAQHAVRQAKMLATNIVADLRGGPTRQYVHHTLGVVATLGLGDGIFQYKRVVIKGVLAWIMHRGYHVLAIPTWERKVRVLAVWSAAFVFGRDIVALPDRTVPRRAFVEAGQPRARTIRQEGTGGDEANQNLSERER